MHLVVGTPRLAHFGGTESYVATIVEALTMLGHDVTVYTPQAGEPAERMRRGGVTVAERLGDLPETADGAVANSADVALELRSRFPRAGVVHVIHGTTFARFAPSSLPGAADALVVMHDRALAWVRGTAAARSGVPVLRLRQPIDPVVRFRPRGTVGPVLRRVAAVGNYVHGERLDLLRRAVEAAGAQLVVVGAMGTPTAAPELEIARADAVVAIGRAALEGMACERPTYVWDHHGGEGWVTPENYERLEADNFAGMATGRALDAAQLADDLARFDPATGVAARDLVLAHHQANAHAARLVDALAVAAEVTRPPALEAAVLLEQARVHRLEWAARERAHELSFALDSALRRGRGLEDEVLELGDRLAAAAAELDALWARTNAAEADALRWRAHAGSRRHRVVQGALRPLDRLRARRR
jgi:hypothetical protein